MRRTVFGFALGLVVAFLIVGAVSVWPFGSHTTEAETMWQAKRFRVMEFNRNDGSFPFDPERWVNDWAATLPASCQIVPLGSDAANPDSITILYACP